ncbi:MAG TPA: glycosyltransferase family 2 protein [Firmicutes bacterium]|nr:glycosyltransferase family 2 protein [Bacillota bacterium]
MKKNSISAVIITKNSAACLPRCLRCLDFTDEIIVVDSESSDETVKIARSHKAHVYVKKFAGYGKNKNFGISKAKGAWVLSVDSDEYVSDTLREELLGKISGSREADGYYITRRNYFYGKWLRFGGQYPDYHMRLFRKGKGLFDLSAVHEGLRLKGRSARLRGWLIHDSKPTVERHISDINLYTGLETEKKPAKKEKPFYYRVLFKPVLYFVKNYFFKMGFLDGAGGFIFHVNSAMYLFITAVKKLEKKGGPGKSGR